MENKAKKFNVVDLLIVILILCCLGGIALRFLLVKNTPDPLTLPDIPAQKYQVSYIVRNLKHSVTDYIKEGEMFRFADTNKEFGTVYGPVDVQNAQKRYVDAEGNYVTVYNMATEEKAKRFDVTGSFLVNGKMTEDGLLVVDSTPSKTYSLNRAIGLRNDLMSFTVYITDIKPAS